MTDAKVVTLAVAQAIMDIASDREFLAVARQRLWHLIPKPPQQLGYWKRRASWPTQSSGSRRGYATRLSRWWVAWLAKYPISRRCYSPLGARRTLG